jgi:transcriptional regulator with XRE-family HTH domain
MSETRMFSVLLRHHRHARGMSQLDLATSAGISAKHLSFLETGRAQPSRDMILRLGGTLALPLREQNALFLAAGFRETFPAVELAQLSAPIQRALEHMMSVHEPYPVLVLDATYDILMLNRGARALLSLALPKERMNERLNLLTLCFDSHGLRPFFVDWERMARRMLARLTREHLQTGRAALGMLLSRILAFPDLPADFRAQDFSHDMAPVMELRLRVGNQCASFLSTLTKFSDAHDVTLEELLIESHYPLDQETEQLCQGLADALPKG